MFHGSFINLKITGSFWKWIFEVWLFYYIGIIYYICAVSSDCKLKIERYLNATVLILLLYVITIDYDYELYFAYKVVACWLMGCSTTNWLCLSGDQRFYANGSTVQTFWVGN